MAVVIKKYRNCKCVKCGNKTKTERVTEGYTFGNPFYLCPHCRALNYDPCIYEPALLSKKKLLEDNKKQWNTILLLLYMPIGFFALFALSMAFSSFIYGALIVVPILAFLTFLILKKRNSKDLSQYSKSIGESVLRLDESDDYRQAVIKLQGIDEDSAYAERNVTANL